MATNASASPSASGRPGFLAHGVVMLRRTPPFLAGMAVLSLALVIAASILVRGVRRANDTITVTGASTERIRSDHVDWTVQVSGSGTSQQASWAALQPALASTISFLRAQGVKADELEQGAVRSESSEVRDPRTNELRSVSWTTRQSLRVSSWDVGRIRRISGRIGELIGQGIPLTIEEPAYTFTRLAEKRVDMLGKATRDARQRAGTIAREAGSAIGAITSADTGTFQITPPNSTEASNAGSYDTSTIDKDITAVMAVTFRVH